MLMIKEKLHEYILQKQTGLTISPANFLPFILASAEEAEQIMAGNIRMKAAVSAEDAGKIAERVPRELLGVYGEEALAAGGIVNFADFSAKCLGMYPLVFQEDRFVKPSRRFLSEGTDAIVITEPAELIRRITGYYEAYHANQNIVEVGAAQYKGIELEPDRFDIYARKKGDAWKKEMLVLARIKPIAVMVEVKEPTDERISIGDISGIAVRVKTKDLIQGRFPGQILTPSYIEMMQGFDVKQKEVRGWFATAAGNIMEVAPVNKWIQIFEKILPDTEWKACTFVEKLFADGDAMPRLAFYRMNQSDKIFFKINRVDFHFCDYGSEERMLVRAVMKCLERELGTRFCHMAFETNADLGTVTEKGIAEQTGLSESRTGIRKNLVCFQKLEMDYRIGINILGINTAKKSWHYTVRVSTPENEHILWYDAEDVLRFYSDAETMNRQSIDYLIRGKVYARYHKMR